MQTIYKYPFSVDDEVRLQLPRGARILSVGKQRPKLGELELWALVDTSEVNEERILYIRGTGHQIGDSFAAYRVRFIDTVADGPLIWHIFESPYPPPPSQ